VIIGERFVWAHLPKAGGDATHAMLSSVPGLVQFADPLDSNDKHLPFFAREEQLHGKLIVMNIRRLPSWALSAAEHRSRHGVYPDFRPGPRASADEIAGMLDADNLLAWMTDHGRIAVDHWLRMEVLEQDVLHLLATLGVLSAEARAGVAQVGRRNASSYVRDIRARLSDEQVRRLYENNPQWASIERRVYGALMDDSEAVAGERPHL
jgi:hypothetical protein